MIGAKERVHGDLSAKKQAIFCQNLETSTTTCYVFLIQLSSKETNLISPYHGSKYSTEGRIERDQNQICYSIVANSSHTSLHRVYQTFKCLPKTVSRPPNQV